MNKKNSSKLSLVISVSAEDDISVFEQSLKSASFADEVIVYSMEVDDVKLTAILKPYQTKVIKIKKPKIVEEIRQRQVQETKFNWVLILDYDEIVTSTLKQEILSLLNSSHPAVGAYAIPRHNYSLGYRIRHGGWNDDYQVRLIKKDAFIDWPNIIHVVPKVKGKILKLKNPIKHYKDSSLEYIVAKTNRYSEAEAELFFEGGLKPVTSFTLLRKLNMEVFRRGILKLGILDGAIGIIQSIYQGFSVFITYAKLYEKQINKK